jgi:hypothetical protein
MKTILTLLSTLLIFVADPLIDVPFAAIEKAFNAQDSKTIIMYGKEKLMLNILDKDGIYNPAQASLVLSDFFNKNPKGNFSFVFKGKETEDGVYSFGYYQANSGKFKVSLHFHKVKNEMKFETLTISKEKK